MRCRRFRSLQAMTIVALVLTAGMAVGAETPTPQLDGGEPHVVGRTHTLDSSVLDQQRTITVGLPANYDETDSSYAVLYVLDGGTNFSTVQGAAEFLARYGKIPPMIVVALHNAGNRTSEMTPEEMQLHRYEGTGNRFLDFIERELIPAVDKHYRTLPVRILHGHSHGAIIGTYAFATRPDLFRWHLMMDLPSRRGDSYIERTVLTQLSQNPDRGGRLVTANAKFGWASEDWEKLISSAPGGLYLDQMEIENETHETMLYRGTYEGLESLFHDYALEETCSQTLADLQERYGKMSSDYGYAIQIPQRLLEDNILDMVYQQRGTEAKALHDYMIETHGTGGRFRDWGAIIPEIIAAGPAEESIADLLAAEPPTPEQMSPYLGTWEGVVEDQQPFPLRVHFSVEGGRVVARTSTRISDRPWGEGTPHVSMRLREDGILEWGIYNNMRPFFIKMYTVSISGDTLTGRTVMRGGRLQNIMPDLKDEDIPTFEFALTRQPATSQRGRSGS